MTTSCAASRERLVELSRGELEPGEQANLEAHVATCPECAAALEREKLTDDLLTRLPRRAAASELKERIRARIAEHAAVPASHFAPKKARIPRFAAFAAAALAALTMAAVAVLFLRAGAPAKEQPLVVEAVNDHLRMLYAQSPLEIAASDHHQVKPWFSGKVDFAPVLHFGGDDKFVLAGGSVALFIDRKAALFVFKRRLHEITLLCFRANSLPWPSSYNTHLGDRPALATTRDGFHVLLWQSDALGYALTSDLAEPELRELGELLAGKSDAPAH